MRKQSQDGSSNTPRNNPTVHHDAKVKEKMVNINRTNKQKTSKRKKEIPDKKTITAIIITFVACIYIFFDSIKIGNFFGDFFGFVTALGLACNAILARYAKDRDLVPSAVIGKLCVAIFAFFFVESFDLGLDKEF